MTRISDRRLLRLAALAALASALALAGCGRKGALDPPPSASVTAPPSPDERTSLGQGYDPNTPGYLRAPQQPAVAPAPSTAAAPTPSHSSFFLDFLIK